MASPVTDAAGTAVHRGYSHDVEVVKGYFTDAARTVFRVP
jgi:hypothetical protein